eukprot:Skav222422  [mRNA]  locus=scaffold2890:171634:188316:+ [translate_table: standard]
MISRRTASHSQQSQALVSRIVRADVNLPENISVEYPEASRCTRAMLRQQPDRRPSAMSLLNRPRLQPPSYELPGMSTQSTQSTPRDGTRFDHYNRDRHRELGSRPRHLAERGTAAKAAFSPRVRGNEVEDFKDEKYGIQCIHQYVTHKGIIDDATDPGRPRGVSGRPTASPVIIASGVPRGSEMRTGSREAPLSARPKAYQAQWPQPVQRKRKEQLLDSSLAAKLRVHRIRGTVFELLPAVPSDPHSAIHLRLALVDIVLERSEAVTPRLLRRVVAFPPQLTRHDLLRALHIHTVCDGHDMCRLFLEDVLWPFGDHAAHDLHHGSYVLLRLPFELRDQHGQDLCDFYIDEGLSLCPSLALLAADGSSVSPMSSLPSAFDPALEFPDGVAPDQLSPSPSLDSQFAAWRFQAWFIRHGTCDVCRGMRPLELWPHFARWRNSIEGAWSDVLDPATPFSLHLVHPQPTVVTPGFPNVPHLLIEQDTPVGYCAILVSVVALDEQALPFQQQLALSVPAFGPTSVLLQLLGLDDLDDSWQLDIHIGDTMSAADGVLDLLTGQLVVLTLRSPDVSRGSSEPEAEDVDDSSLLALGSLPLGSPPVVQLAVQKHVINIDEGSQEAHQWLPPAMRPGAAGDNGTSSEGPPIGSVDALFEWWHTLDFEDGDPQRQAPEFLTYFLHGRRVPTCRDARWVIPLPPLSPEGLMARFRQCWLDLVDHDAPLFVFPVFPQPPDLRPHRPVIHVLLLQEPLDLFSPMLLSKQVQDDMWSHAAFLIATPTHRFAALMLAEVAPLCFRATMVMDCEVLVGDSVLTSTAVQHVPPRLNIKVTVHERLPDGPLPAILSLGAAEVPVTLQVAMDMAGAGPPDRYVPIHTWYIDHRRWQVCEQPRTLVLQPSALEAWMVLAQNLWADRVMPSRSIQVSVVAPHPGPRAAVPNSMHVILEQSELRYEPRIPLLISSLVAGFETFQAVSVEPRMSCNSLVWFAGLDDCQPLGPRSCKCVFGEQEFVHDHPFTLDPGSFVRILPGLPALDVPTDDDDSSSLLQFLSASSVPRTLASPPVQLCLDALIESGPHQRQKTRLCDSAPSLHWFQHASWRQQCFDAPLPSLAGLPEGLQLTPASYWALVKDPSTMPSPTALRLYVDGATGYGGAGWAVIVVLDSLDGEFFLGCVWGRVQLDMVAPDWVGAREPDNIAAELSAALYALYLGLRLPFALPVFLCPDLAFSLDLCQQTCVTSTPNARLAQMVRVVYSWHVECGLDKIAGHSHHPWNDLADTLAKFAIHHPMDSAPFVIEPLHELALEPHDLAWVWQQQMAPSYAQCVPALLEGQFHQFRPCWQSISVPDIASPVKDPCYEWLSLQLVSANVLALDRLDPETLPTRRSAERTMRLDSQMHLRGVHLLGIQEARTPQGRYESDHYVILASGADHSHSACLGCELWLHKSAPCLFTPAGEQVPLSRATLTVVHADPRRLLVRVRVASIVWVLVVLHAPYRSATFSDDQLWSWWHETADLISKVGAVWCSVFVDANADLPSTTDPETADPERPFEWFVSHLGLLAPACDPTLHSGPSWTWTHPRGHRSRRDFVLLSADFAQLASASQVLYDHDVSFAHDDHVPVWVQLDGKCMVEPLAARYRWDPDKLQDPQTVAAFQAALHTLPLPTWQVNVDDHSALWHQQVLQLGQQFFAATRTRRNRLGLQPSTIQAIRFKRDILDAARRLGLMTDVDFKPVLRSIEKFVRRLVHADLQCYFDSVVGEVDCAALSGASKDLFTRLRRLGSARIKRPGPRPLPALKRHDGTLACTYEEQQTLWMQQFAATEAGVSVTWQSLMEVHKGQVNIPFSDLAVEAFPQEWQLLRCLARLKRNKAPGPDQLPSALLKAGGTPLARQLATLLLKVVSTTTEPLLWKGGRAAPLWKGKASPQNPDSYRSIFISNFTTKLFHQCLRQHLVDSWLATSTALQCGGRPFFGTDLAHHLVQAHAHWCTHHRRPHAVVFFDFKAAFYSVLRQGLTQFPIDPQRLFHDAQLRGLDQPHLARLVSALQLGAEELGLDPHVDRMLADVLTNTFFTVDGVPEPCATARGTRPGDPVGDVLFNIVMASLLADLRRALQRHTGLPWLTDPGPCADFATWQDPPPAGIGDVSFVDDCAILIHAEHNDALEQLLRVVLQTFTSQAARRGLVVNFEAGKSEIVWSTIGPGARAARQRLAASGHWFAWDPDVPASSVRVVHAYRHLGTWIQASNSHRREIIARGSAARQSWGPLARSFYGHRAVSTSTKAKVFHALSLSRFVFQAHVWCGVTAKELQSWTSHLRAPLLQLLRRPLHGLRAFELSTPVLAGLLGVLPPADLLHVARLRYFGRFLRMCPPMLWNWLSALFQSGLGWLSDCVDSFRWLTTFYRAASLPSADAPLADWVTWVRLDAAWRGRIRTAAAQCLRYHQRLAEHRVWQVRFRQTLAQAQVQLPSDVPAPPSPEWCCEVCAATFSSRRALATHAYKVHGYRAEVRYYGDTGLCNACGLLFHDRARLHRHLLGSSDCFDTLRATAPPLTEAEVDDLDEAARTRAKELKQQGWLPTKALVAVQQTYGPLLPSPTEPAAQEMYRRRALRTPTPGHRFRCLEGRRIDAAPSGASVWWTSSDIPPLVFQSTGGAQVGGGALAMGSLAREAARLHVCALTFVHFFSGFRIFRTFWSTPFARMAVRCSSSQWTFASKSKTPIWRHRSRWPGGAAESMTDSFSVQGEGPPARRGRRRGFSMAGHPPFLKPIPTLTSRQSIQVLIGTRLLQFLWTLLVDLALAGGCGFCEHPQYPLWAAEQRPASIWITEPSRLLRGLACFQAVSYDQCVYGAVAIKPTTLLLLRMPSFRIQTLCAGRMGRCPHGRAAHEGLAGLQDDGAFKTSRCKVYPEAMNRALSRAIHSFVDVTFADCSLAQVLPVEFQPYRATAFASEADVQKDYYPEAAGD